MANKDHEKKQEQKVYEDPIEILRKLCRGTFRLLKPLRSGGKDVEELQYDFCALTGEELLNALDNGGAGNMFGISNRQAMQLFATTAANCTEIIGDDGEARHLFANEIAKGLSAVDAIKAVQLAKLFYNASTRAERKAPEEQPEAGK